MNTRILYGFGHSGHSYKVASYLQLANLHFEARYVDFFHGGTRSPEFLQLNPMGEAPIYCENDQIYTQSGMILLHLVQQTGHFATSNWQELQRWLLWDAHKGSSQWAMARFMNNFFPEEKRNADVVAFLLSRSQASILTLENHLSTRDFMIDNQFSLIDIVLSAYLFFPEEFGWQKEKTPAIIQWLERIRNQPRWVHAYDLLPKDQDMIDKTPAASHWHKPLEHTSKHSAN